MSCANSVPLAWSQAGRTDIIGSIEPTRVTLCLVLWQIGFESAERCLESNRGRSSEDEAEVRKERENASSRAPCQLIGPESGASFRTSELDGFKPSSLSFAKAF